MSIQDQASSDVLKPRASDPPPDGPVFDNETTQRKQAVHQPGELEKDENKVDFEKTIISSQPPIKTSSSNSNLYLPPSELGPTLVGRNLAHFKLLHFVGGGGMGAVFKAVDTMLQRIVAVKVLSRDQGRDEETVKRFQNEAQSTARLDHEYIARVYFVGEEDGWYFIVFEYIDGINLRDLVERDGAMDVQTAFRFTVQIAEALDHASRRDVVHRDIKPSNILVSPEGRAKLVDMGLARLHHVHTKQDDLTATGVTLGTFDYISPEQARDPRAADVRSDIYSLGCTLYFMLTGRPPFPEGTVLQKLLSHSSDSPPDLADLRNDVPAELNVVLQKMLAKKPKDRYQKPNELIGDLVIVAEQYGWQVSTRGEPIFIAPSRSTYQWAERHLPWIVPVAIFFFFMVFLDPIWLSNQQGTTSIPRPPFDDEHVIRDVASPQATDTLEHSNPNPADDAFVDSNSEESLQVKEPLEDEDENGLFLPMRLIVADPTQEIETDESILPCESLAQAIDYTKSIQGSKQIEIWSNGFVEISDEFFIENQQLTIVAGQGFQPILRVDQQERNSLFRIVSSNVDLVGLHLLVRIDSAMNQSSVFELTEGSEVSLSKCTVTVNDEQSSGSSMNEAALFRVANEESNEISKRIKIRMQDCAIRGKITAIQSAVAQPIEVDWNNGLFVSNQRFLEMTGGVPETSLDSRENSILLKFKNVTSIIDRGLVSLRTDSRSPYFLPLRIESNNSLFVTQMGATWLKWVGVSIEDVAEIPFEMVGTKNHFQGMTSFRRFYEGDKELEVMSLQEWKNEFRREGHDFHGKIRWRSVLDDKPVNECRKADYRLDYRRMGISIRDAGFIDQDLPDFKTTIPFPKNIDLEFPF